MANCGTMDIYIRAVYKQRVESAISSDAILQSNGEINKVAAGKIEKRPMLVEAYNGLQASRIMRARHAFNGALTESRFAFALF